MIQFDSLVMRSVRFALLLGMVRGFEHEWDTLGSMLGANFHGAGDGRYTPDAAALSNWKWVASNYAVIVLDRFEDFNGPEQGNGYPNNCTAGSGESSRTAVARILKSLNPSIKLLWYQNEHGDCTCACCFAELRAHPEWWWNSSTTGLPLTSRSASDCVPVATSSCDPYVDWRVPAAREWFAKLPLAEVNSTDDYAKLIDGFMIDGSQYGNPFPHNTTAAEYDAVFQGKMTMLSDAQAFYQELNGGEVWGNPLFDTQDVGTPGKKGADYNFTLRHYGGAFDEMFGSYFTLDGNGEWDVVAMEESIYAMRNASNDGKSITLHLSPGPAYPPFLPVNGSGLGGVHPVTAASWRGNYAKLLPTAYMKAPEYAPVDVLNAIKRVGEEKLVESLAPFLIAAGPTSFFSYAWFYDIESGYTPCEGADRTLCLAPDGWFAEYSKPLGAPVGPALQDGHVWTREFGNGSHGCHVFVDLENRSKATITWKQ